MSMPRDKPMRMQAGAAHQVTHLHTSCVIGPSVMSNVKSYRRYSPMDMYYGMYCTLWAGLYAVCTALGDVAMRIYARLRRCTSYQFDAIFLPTDRLSDLRRNSST